MDECEISVKMISAHACYEWSANPLMRWIDNNGVFLGAFLIVIGIVIGLFGKSLFKPTICLVGTMAFTLLSSLFIFSLVFSRESSETAEWIVFSICLVLGCVVGLLLASLMKIGIAVLAGWGGFCLGLMLYNAFLYKIDTDGKAVFWIFNISFAVIAAVLSLIVVNHAIIVTTAIGGAYALMRGISMYAGGFPNEMELYYLIKLGGIDEMPGYFYIYLAFFFLISIGFMVF
jgi:hypothetical protein